MCIISEIILFLSKRLSRNKRKEISYSELPHNNVLIISDNYFQISIQNKYYRAISSCRSRKSIHSDIARGREDRVDMVHNNRVRGAGVRHISAQHPHVHLQVVEETAVYALSRGFHHGNVSRGGLGLDVPGSASGTGRRQGGDVDQLRVLRSWTVR